MELDADTPLISSGIVDSFSMVSLKRFLEKQYDVRLPDISLNPLVIFVMGGNSIFEPRSICNRYHAFQRRK